MPTLACGEYGRFQTAFCFIFCSLYILDIYMYILFAIYISYTYYIYILYNRTLQRSVFDEEGKHDIWLAFASPVHFFPMKTIARLLNTPLAVYGLALRIHTPQAT